MSSIAAVSGPTPTRLSRPGARAVTSGVISWPGPGELLVKVVGAAAELAQRQQGVVADHAARAGPERGQLGDQFYRRLPGKPGADVVRPGDDQRPGLVDRLGPLRPGGALGHHQRPDRLDLAITAPGRSRCAAGQGRPRGADRIGRIGLARAPPVLPVRPAGLDNPDPGGADVPGQARAVTAGALDADQADRAKALQPAG